MSYIQGSLSKGEVVHKVFPHHWFIKLGLFVHVLLSVTVIWIPVAIHYWLKWRCTEQGVTNKRVIYKTGIIARDTDEMRLEAIEGIEIAQGIWGRIFGFGEVAITGRGAGDVRLRWVSRPVEVKREIENAEYDLEQSRLSASQFLT